MGIPAEISTETHLGIFPKNSDFSPQILPRILPESSSGVYQEISSRISNVFFSRNLQEISLEITPGTTRGIRQGDPPMIFPDLFPKKIGVRYFSKDVIQSFLQVLRKFPKKITPSLLRNSNGLSIGVFGFGYLDIVPTEISEGISQRSTSVFFQGFLREFLIFSGSPVSLQEFHVRLLGSFLPVSSPEILLGIFWRFQ